MNRALARKAFEASCTARRLATEAAKAEGADRILLKVQSESHYETARQYRMMAMGVKNV